MAYLPLHAARQATQYQRRPRPARPRKSGLSHPGPFVPLARQDEPSLSAERVILPPGDWFAVRGMPLARARVLTCLALSGSGAMARIVDHLPVAELEARFR